mmetsp:Transcript_115606/g.258293  ORF Transcript_115606/g.258293 Transcript_115606/m.258293 type:complete len:659 (+) Transcript_115606:90-2066(+)
MGRYRLCCLAAFLTAAQMEVAEVLNQHTTALALLADDECGGDSQAHGDGACSLNALQLRGARIGGLRTGAPQDDRGAGDAGESSPPPLCDKGIVAETCARVNQVTREYFGTAADADLTVVHAAELAEQLMVSRTSILLFLADHLRAVNLETDKYAISQGSFAVACNDLCKKTIEGIPEAHRPPSSDRGCYRPSGSAATSPPRCDIDVSVKTLGDLRFEDHKPEEAVAAFREHLVGHDVAPGGSEELQKLKDLAQGRSRPNTTAELEALKALMYPQKDFRELSVAIANLFRVYPLASIDVSLNSVPPLAAGSDAAREAADAALGQLLVNRSGLAGAEGSNAAYWKDTVKQVAVKAQAYTSLALRNLNTRAADAHLKTWFGRVDFATKREVRRVLNGVHSLLSNVDYIYPGPKCRQNVFAYVHPNPPANKNRYGQYVFNLCDLYMKTDLGQKIETLTHEGSHHQTMSTDDVCISGSASNCRQKAYGRSTCKRLARASPNGALNNADNFCYFVNDVAGHPAASCPTRPSCTSEAACGCSAGAKKGSARSTTGGVCYYCQPGSGSSGATDYRRRRSSYSSDVRRRRTSYSPSPPLPSYSAPSPSPFPFPFVWPFSPTPSSRPSPSPSPFPFPFPFSWPSPSPSPPASLPYYPNAAFPFPFYR